MILDRIRGHGIRVGRPDYREVAHATVVYSADLTAAAMLLDGEPEDPIPTVPDGDDDTDESTEGASCSQSRDDAVPPPGSPVRTHHQPAPRATGNPTSSMVGSGTPSPSVALPVDPLPQHAEQRCVAGGDPCVNLAAGVGEPVSHVDSVWTTRPGSLPNAAKEGT